MRDFMRRGAWLWMCAVVLSCTAKSGDRSPAGNGSTESELETFWPPPPPSARFAVPRSLLAKDAAATFASVTDRLELALRRAGHAEWSFYDCPGGFALASRLEKIDDDGKPMAGDERWADKIRAVEEFRLVAYLRALFKPRRGRWRVIVFVVTDRPLHFADTPAEKEAIGDLVLRGASRLPAPMRTRAFGPHHACTALVYEFHQSTPDHEPAQEAPSRWPGRAHLRSTGVLAHLGGVR